MAKTAKMIMGAWCIRGQRVPIPFSSSFLFYSFSGIRREKHKPATPDMEPFTKDLVRGNLCAFVSGYHVFLPETLVAVRSVHHFMPGMRMTVATHPGEFSVFNRWVPVLWISPPVDLALQAVRMRGESGQEFLHSNQANHVQIYAVYPEIRKACFVFCTVSGVSGGACLLRLLFLFCEIFPYMVAFFSPVDEPHEGGRVGLRQL